MVGAELVINEVERTIDLTSQLVKSTATLTLQNTGESPINQFSLAFTEDEIKHLAFVQISDKVGGELKFSLDTGGEDSNGFRTVSLDLWGPLAPGGIKNLVVETVLTHSLKPYPAKKAQSEKQQVLFTGTLYFYTPYKVKTQKSSVKLASSTIESHTKTKPFSVSDDVISYGPYEDISPLTNQELKIHYENNSPFLVVNEMVRWIEVSHWGNVAVEETYLISHGGAQLKGHFSRYDYQRSPAHAAIKSFKTVLPAAAKDVYYRDEIGNISTSNMLTQDDSVEVEIRPRFPLFGGWRTKYYLGYNVPAYQYLYNKGEKFILKMRFIDHVFDDFVVDQLTLKIVLPEACRDIKSRTPYVTSRDPSEVLKTYLDVVGRPVLIFKKKNLVEGHIQDFEIHYDFEKILVVQEPLLCVAAFLILFLSVIGMVRIDFSITKDTAKESRMKIASLVEELLTACDRRATLYASFNSIIDTFKQSRDQAAFTTSLKTVNLQYSALTGEINEICEDLVKEDEEIVEKTSELQKKESERKSLVDQASTLASKVVAGKIGRPQYMESEQTIFMKREKLGEDIDTMLASL